MELACVLIPHFGQRGDLYDEVGRLFVTKLAEASAASPCEPTWPTTMPLPLSQDGLGELLTFCRPLLSATLSRLQPEDGGILQPQGWNRAGPSLPGGSPSLALLIPGQNNFDLVVCPDGAGASWRDRCKGIGNGAEPIPPFVAPTGDATRAALAPG